MAASRAPREDRETEVADRWRRYLTREGAVATDMPERAIGTPPQVYARAAGLIYLIIAIMAPFGEFFVRQRLIVPGNAVATGANIVASESLFRAGFASDLVVFVFEVALAAVLYVLFRPVSRILALVMSFARLAMATILGFNLLNMFTGLQLRG